MDNIYKPLVSKSCSPQRRRLSVPETIMRKHTLAIERSTFRDLKAFQWNQEMDCSSDLNLNRKKDSNFIRKSTLLRRLWGDEAKPKLSGSFQEWQHSYKRSSNQSSPEHLTRNMDPTTSPSRKSRLSRASTKSLNEDLSALQSLRRKAANAPFKELTLSRESTSKYTYSSFSNVSDSNSKFSNSNTDRSDNRALQESAVQTSARTNLNVISNVSLSQSTLDTIFKEVMKDMDKISSEGINISTATVVSDEKSDIRRDHESSFVISKVKTGSPYFKPSAGASQTADILRFSAVPRTSSMEVNASEEDKEESDGVSCVDSLEDYSSPRDSSDIAQLLPEGKKKATLPSSSFFIPIQAVNETEARSVSELLPLKVRERLNERQQRREDKFKRYRSSIVPKTKNISVIKSSLNCGSHKRRSKPVLPSIASLTKTAAYKGDSSNKRNVAQSNLNRDHRSVDIMDRNKKSKIPVLVCSKQSELVQPCYSDLDNHVIEEGPKTDQLIANILIGSLHHDDSKNANVSVAENQTNLQDTNENCLTIPKGWVTVHTVRKDLESPESTSDEGKKNDSYTSNYARKVACGNPLNLSAPLIEKPPKEVENNSCTNEKTDGRRKNSPEDWSVTICGSNKYGQMAPDVEMRLNFPKNGTGSRDSSFDDEKRNCTFPHIINDKRTRNLHSYYYSQEKHKATTGSPILPNIRNETNQWSRFKGKEVLPITPSVIIPRQTKTSTSRYHFSRPRRERHSLPTMPPILNEREYLEIMKRIPNVLAVTGRSISPEHRLFEER